MADVVELLLVLGHGFVGCTWILWGAVKGETSVKSSLYTMEVLGRVLNCGFCVWWGFRSWVFCGRFRMRRKFESALLLRGWTTHQLSVSNVPALDGPSLLDLLSSVDVINVCYECRSDSLGEAGWDVRGEVLRFNGLFWKCIACTV